MITETIVISVIRCGLGFLQNERLVFAHMSQILDIICWVGMTTSLYLYVTKYSLCTVIFANKTDKVGANRSSTYYFYSRASLYHVPFKLN